MKEYPNGVALPATGYVRMDKLAAHLSVGRSTIYEWMRSGTFPSPVSLGSKAVAWRVEDVREWLEKRHAAAHVSKRPSDLQMNLFVRLVTNSNSGGAVHLSRDEVVKLVSKDNTIYAAAAEYLESNGYRFNDEGTNIVLL